MTASDNNSSNSEIPPTKVLPSPKRRPFFAVIAATLPVVTSIVILVYFFVFLGHGVAAEVVATSLLTMTVMGKFIVIFPESGKFFSTPNLLAALVVYLDVCIAFIAVFNIDLLYRIPKFGSVLLDLKSMGQTVLARNSWMRKISFVGLAAFVMFPLSGTGAIGGAFFGELLGMTKARIMWGVLVGSLAGAYGLAFAAEWLRDQVGKENLDHPAIRYGGMVIIALIVMWLTARYKRFKRETAPVELPNA